MTTKFVDYKNRRNFVDYIEHIYFWGRSIKGRHTILPSYESVLNREHHTKKKIVKKIPNDISAIIHCKSC